MSKIKVLDDYSQTDCLATAFSTFFCDKTLVFDIQTWQTTLEHYYVYVQTYFLSQHRKMLILLISSYVHITDNTIRLSVANNTNTRDRIVGNRQILQWDLMSKINILRS